MQDKGGEFGQRVRDARVALGWSQRKLGEKVGLSTNHIGALERGEKEPTRGTMQALSEGLGVPLGALLGPSAPDSDALIRLVQSVPGSRERSYLHALVALSLRHFPSTSSKFEDADFADRLAVLTRGMTAPEREQVLGIVEALRTAGKGGKKRHRGRT